MKSSARLLMLAGLLPAANAQAIDLESNLYGEANIAYEWRDPTDDDWKSWVSRIGVKGKYSLTKGIDVIYQVEQEVDLAHGGTDQETLFSTRNSYIGVSGRYGKFFFGAHDTPFKKAQGKVDLFNDQAGDIKGVVAGEVRGKDSYAYHSPKLSDWQIQAMYLPGDRNFDSSQSLSAQYNRGEWFIGLGVDSDMRKNDKSVGKTKVYDSYRGAMQYTPGAWKFGLLMQRSERQNAIGAEWESGYTASVSYKVSNVTLMVQHGNSDIVGHDVDSSNVGIHYNFSKKTKAYLYYWDYEKSGDSDVLSLGIEHKF